jgi:hypothetical protein
MINSDHDNLISPLYLLLNHLKQGERRRKVRRSLILVACVLLAGGAAPAFSQGPPSGGTGLSITGAEVIAYNTSSPPNLFHRLLISGENLVGSGGFSGTVELFFPEWGWQPLSVVSADPQNQEVLAALGEEIFETPGTMLLKVTVSSGTKTVSDTFDVSIGQALDQCNFPLNPPYDNTWGYVILGNQILFWDYFYSSTIDQQTVYFRSYFQNINAKILNVMIPGRIVQTQQTYFVFDKLNDYDGSEQVMYLAIGDWLW